MAGEIKRRNTQSQQHVRITARSSLNELGTNLGPEFVALADALKNMDPNSQAGPQVGLIFNKLDALCED